MPETLVMKSRRSLKGTKFVISDDLTVENYKLMNRLKNQHPECEHWFANVKVFVKKHNRVQVMQPHDNINEIFK